MSNPSQGDRRKGRGQPEGKKKKDGRHPYNAEHLCKVIAATAASVQKRRQAERSEAEIRSCLDVLFSEKEMVTEVIEANDDEKR